MNSPSGLWNLPRSPFERSYSFFITQTLRLDDLDFRGDEELGDQGGEVGHDPFDFGAAAGEACDGGRAGEDERGDLFGEAFHVEAGLAADADAGVSD